MATEDEIEQRIAEEQAKIDVPSYQDAAWDSAWKRRAGAMWGLSTLGLAAGAAIGVAAAGVAALASGNVALSWGLIGNSVAMFSALGTTAGFAVGGIMGPSAGGAAGAIREFERRTLAREIEQKIRENPDAAITLKKQEAEADQRPSTLSDYYNPKTSLLFAAIGAIGGLVFAAAFIATGGLAVAGVANASAITAYAMPAMSSLLGTATPSIAALMTYSIGVGATSGATFGFNFPMMGRRLVNFANDLLGGKAIGAPWPKGSDFIEHKPILTPVVTMPEISMEHPVEGKHCGCVKNKAPAKNYEDLVARSIAEADMAMAR